MSNIAPLSPGASGVSPSAPAAPKTPLFGKQAESEDNFMAMRRRNLDNNQNSRIKAAAKGALREVLKPSALLRDVAISGLITLATCWLPGSQLLTIPAYLAISAAFRAIAGAEHGYKNPNGSNQPIRHGTTIMFPITSTD